MIDRLTGQPHSRSAGCLGRRRIVRRGFALVAKAHVCLGDRAELPVKTPNWLCSAKSSCRFARASWPALAMAQNWWSRTPLADVWRWSIPAPDNRIGVARFQHTIFAGCRLRPMGERW